MKKHLTYPLALFILIQFAVFSNIVAADHNFTIVEVSSPVDPSEKLLIIESDDSLLLNSLNELLVEYPELVRINKPSEPEFNSMLVIARQKKFIDKDHTARDCLLGVGFCAGGIAFIQATGEDTDNTSTTNTMYAQAGNKVVTGGNACFVSALWVTGIVFGIKGIIEIFSKEKGYVGEVNSNWNTRDLLNNTTLIKLDEKAFSIKDKDMIARKLMPYILIKTW